MQTIVTIGMILLVALFVLNKLLPAKGVKTIQTGQLKDDLRKYKNQKQWIDVRTPGEYQANHIKEFKNYPLQTLKHNTQSLDTSKEVVVICQSGARSLAATKILKKAGFSDVTNVQGGMNAWK
ncbi:rhodanese-like domain-containing protein [Pontibacillus litoralis]|uniref:Sulfurtransferase n=1 Tax=Pontibacillus litoralis JSM 072002 TaxID=1385512 RepID=A0A0A5HTI0_9BACI|nr:rhodanese-like domain-containing protein [Pontibacillus litoralis]KGX86927.1 sulfurtransferase [Pontibacillus litoralis JSM 072002]